MSDTKPLWMEYKTEYSVWAQMLNRCRNSNHPQYHYWGGRGITVCERWHTFSNFLADMGKRPSRKHTLDRRDGNGNYEPANCYWATFIEQNNNLRSNIRLTYNGQTKTLAQWARILNIPYDTIRARYRYGWPAEDILTVPKNKHHKDRINNDKNVVLTYGGKSLNLAQWARELGVSYEVIRSRYKYGWSTERILTHPIRKRK